MSQNIGKKASYDFPESKVKSSDCFFYQTHSLKAKTVQVIVIQTNKMQLVLTFMKLKPEKNGDFCSKVTSVDQQFNKLTSPCSFNDNMHWLKVVNE